MCDPVAAITTTAKIETRWDFLVRALLCSGAAVAAVAVAATRDATRTEGHGLAVLSKFSNCLTYYVPPFGFAALRRKRPKPEPQQKERLEFLQPSQQQLVRAAKAAPSAMSPAIVRPLRRYNSEFLVSTYTTDTIHHSGLSPHAHTHPSDSRPRRVAFFSNPLQPPPLIATLPLQRSAAQCLAWLGLPSLAGALASRALGRSDLRITQRPGAPQGTRNLFSSFLRKSLSSSSTCAALHLHCALLDCCIPPSWVSGSRLPRDPDDQ
ncbi:hypothetical protein CSOJ01_02298 [Colletotrichum sojae]|uniref:Uncharacterized protein n=1 Tax=Colletotrichum sojae TaxID=2175907 RepID=A0A8H6JRB9_9PEZI|nr:hypothetical protein CSOJ01_02298 [Colletotrichum sojae]